MQIYYTLSLIVITLMFFISGIDKFLNFNKVVKGFHKRVTKKFLFFKNFPYIFFNLAIIIVILIEIVSPIIIVNNSFHHKYNKLARYSTISLLIFTILATLIYHFPPRGAVYYPFISNITTCGALLLILYTL